ncbi:flagellar hook-associated protein FlgK [Cellulomonas triticagri]|uniref:Flagellar hook-associated protein 1 n=1 Tax=Cellulomonas triticagri TaxID=2483352 RepID=A0A3M2J745_9CELL|nr:flagellar hook-associated protein FlgK [Cellulomonas triticagri]RMI06765.1 flagellar hook-associated protein FlgK [Cellulomonas triticagri]
MSTFSGLGTALSSLIAQRQALEVSGQNVANANTVGYTRQRAALGSLPAATVPSMFSTTDGVGQGTTVTGFERLGDVFLDARLRNETSGAARLAAIATEYKTLETTIGEPSKTGFSADLSDFWSAWSEVAGSPNAASSRAVLLERGTAVADRLATLYQDTATQWDQALTTTKALVTQVNTTAANVADLNTRILSITNAGGSANELMDQRDLLVTELSGLVGASTRTNADGTMDVLVGGNTLVSGSKVSQLTVAASSPASFQGAVDGGAVSVVWAESGHPSGIDGGRVAGLLSVLAPPSSGGVLTGSAVQLNSMATTIATQVNAIHSTAYTEAGYETGTTAGDFFAIDASRPAALGLSVAITDPKDIGVAAGGKGPVDGSIATQMAKLAHATDGPDAQWSAFVVDLGVKSASATSRATVAEAARSTASAAQLAQTSVDTDEETVNMLAFQRAYEGAARVLTAIDEMLDTLINRTGVVGR